jgi:osmotically-inducible protein OsmY
MPDRNRDRLEKYRNVSEGWHQQLRRRGEDVYGDGDDYLGEGYKHATARKRSANQGRAEFQYRDDRNEDVANYGVGGYYGNTYRQNSRDRERFGLNGPEQRQGYRSNDERLNAQQGIHRGKGPKNYERSDTRIYDDINDFLSEDSFIDASDIEVRVTNGEVTLKGSVDSRADKDRAEDIAESVSGVKNVENSLRVKRNTDWRNRDGNFENRMIETKRGSINQEVQ